jgi:outer membrane protein TolC
MDDWSQNRYPGYYVGLTFSFPIGNTTRQAQLSQARAATRGAEFLVRDTRTSVSLDVDQAYTDLSTARKQVEAADKALTFRQMSMDAEMAKLENGMSTSFFVLQRQDELDQARSADLEARINAEKARTNLERAMGRLVAIVQ